MIPKNQNKKLEKLTTEMTDGRREEARAFRAKLIASGRYDALVAAIDAAEASMTRYFRLKKAEEATGELYDNLTKHLKPRGVA